MKLQHDQTVNLRTPADLDALLLAIDAESALARGAHLRVDPLQDVQHGREHLRSLRSRELRAAASSTLRVSERW